MHGIAPIPLMTLPQSPCPYLADRQSQLRAMLARRIDDQTYQALLEAGFRRSGRMVYRPQCPDCNACVPLRVPVGTFRMSKSQRRVWRRNQDLRIEYADPKPSSEKFELYRKYVVSRHQSESTEIEDFVSFLYDSPVCGIEFTYRNAAGELLVVGICDLGQDWLSSVYCYFDPSHARRGLGTFAALHEIEFARASKRTHYYLGYWIEDCNAMKYKSSYKPHELLREAQMWEPAE